MHARVWQLQLQPGKAQELAETIRSLIPPASRQPGYRGVLVLHTEEADKAEAMVIALWESAEAMKASEQGLFLTQAMGRVLSTTRTLPVIRQHEVLLWEMAPAGKSRPADD